MSCVWSGILQAIHQDYLTCMDTTLKHKILSLTITTLVELLKYNNVKTSNVTWNLIIMSEQQLKENYNRIEQININDLHNCYDFSTCDPLFFLLCTIFKVDIIHNYMGNKMEYKYMNNTDNIKSRKIYEFCSDIGHFWFVKILSIVRT